MHASKNTPRRAKKKLKANCETIHSHYYPSLHRNFFRGSQITQHFSVYISYKPVAHRYLGRWLRCYYERSRVFADPFYILHNPLDGSTTVLIWTLTYTIQLEVT